MEDSEEKQSVNNGIKMYFHCRTCMEAGDRQDLAVGWTPKGIQVWCETCDRSVMAADFLGQKITIDPEPDVPRETVAKVPTILN